MTRLALIAALSSLVPLHARADDLVERGTELAAPSPAHREGPPRAEPSEVSLDLDAMTMLPLVVGAVGSLEVPGHIVIRIGGGIVPSAYVDAFNTVGTGWGAWDTASASMLSLLLNDATFLEAGLAFRPAGTPGIELAVSYALLWSHRTFDMTQLGGPAHPAGLDLTIDAIHGELAWQTVPIEHVYFRIAIGWAQAFDHRVSIASDGDAEMQRTMHAAADQLAATVGRSAFGPTLGAALGVRF